MKVTAFWATEHFIKSCSFDLSLDFVVRTPTSAPYGVLLLGTLTHLARTRPRFPLFTSSHDLLVSDPDVCESGVWERD